MTKRGRPRLDDALRKTIQIRVPPDVKADMEKAARVSGLSLSSWARERLMAAARRDLQNFAPKEEISP